MHNPERFSRLAPNVVIGVWNDGKELYKSSSEDCHFRIGSITKIFTAIVIKRLVADGKLGFHDFAEKYIAQIPQEITIEHLATMKSGLPDYTSDSTFLSSCLINPELDWKPEQLISIALKSPLMFAPGESWMYSNTNYIVLGLIIEKITGKSLAQIYNEFIFQPLGMTSTFLPADVSLPVPYFEGFQYIKDTLVNVTNCHPSVALGSGGVVSTLNDLYKFAQVLIKGYLLSFHRCKKSTHCYGFGLMKLGDYFGHNGSFPGYQSILLVNPENNTIIIVLTNLKRSLDDKSPADEIARTIISDINNISY